MIATLLSLFLSLLPAPDPPAWDVERFPPVGCATACRQFATAHRERLKREAEIEPHREYFWWLAAAEQDYEFQCWNTLEDAWLQRGQARRWQLARLRELLGDVAYLRGEMPPVCPVWCLRSGD